MIIPKRPTVLLMIRASTNSKWDACAFAIVHLHMIAPDDIVVWKRALAQASQHDYFSTLRYDIAATHFYSNLSFPTINKDLDEILSTDQKWAYVGLTDTDYESFITPESTITDMELVFTADEFYFAAYGKHTGERFWTYNIPIKVLDAYYHRHIKKSKITAPNTLITKFD